MSADSTTDSARWQGPAQLLALLLLLYGFFVGLDLMGLAFKLFGRGFAEMLIEQTANPLVGLFVGVLATSLVQSSSTTTSMTVGLVAAGALTVEGAIPVIMGANIGTSITNTLVSLAHVTRREEFERAFAGATVHDFFNLLAVAILLPVEMATGYLARVATILEVGLEGTAGIKLFDPLRAVVRPVAEGVVGLVGDSGIITLIIGVALLMACLKFLVDLLKAIMSARAERILHATVLRSTIAAVTAGMLMTVMVQSSSITTSAMIPLVGAGIVTLEQMFPLTIGANLGTTITAMLAALATGNPAAVTVAFAHVMFNVSATLLVFMPPPLRRIPLAMARAMGRVGSRNRLLAAVYIIVVFFLVPLSLLLISGAL
ncbi:MAG TPA: Na/Pi symporter [Acidobacteriota bacterium]|nr:Na/Pi symporter [Acidobacteriota bacterium]